MRELGNRQEGGKTGRIRGQNHTSRLPVFLFKAPLLALLGACATLGSPGQGDVDLPTSGVGPFRKLTATEVREIAPNVLAGINVHYTEPSALAAIGDGSAGVFLYAVATTTDAMMTMNATTTIVRTRADDARSFFGTKDDGGPLPPRVLAADAAWEGGRIGGPSALRVGSQVWLYYHGAGGIGLARSDDGLAFMKEAQPVLVHDPSVPEEGTTIAAPSVAIYPDGSYRMLYASGGVIFEAESADGVTWKRRDADPSTPAIDPVLRPSDVVDPSTLTPGQKPPFDTAAVGDPCLLPRITPAGRLQVRVLYTGVDPSGQTTIGFAARYGDSGALSRQATPLYSVGMHEAAPTLFEWTGGVMLYVHEDYTAMTPTPAIAAGIAPANATLGAPGTYPSGP
jgi:hypothetical protein